ncbi:MAG: DUF2007 domain-containing protein [Saprospiraceae bacterium]|nr:DUF2007 domain-containing protein [Saprospiraceae bacterium]
MNHPDNDDILDNFAFDSSQFPTEEGEGEVVAKFFSVLEAEVAAARLRSEGVPCFLANTTSRSVLPHLQILIRLHVRPADAMRAREILDEAAIDNLAPTSTSTSHLVLLGLAILIGLILAFMLVRAIWGWY